MKPKLPREIQQKFPIDIVCLIYSFVPPLPVNTPYESPGLQHQLERIQKSPLRGKNEMYMKGFDDFILD
jgi:hypothetical protein